MFRLFIFIMIISLSSCATNNELWDKHKKLNSGRSATSSNNLSKMHQMHMKSTDQFKYGSDSAYIDSSEANYTH